jgi:hypothetical protein
MSPPASFSGAAKEEPLPRRDWILLPLISCLTVVLLMGLTEWIARRMFASSKTNYMSCMVLDDPTTGSRGIPNSVCWEKAPESELVEYRFNSCGHRADFQCRPKPAGTYRVVLMGSSVALGQNVQFQSTFASLLPIELKKRTGRAVEVYNEGMGFGFTHRAALHFKEVLDAEPDLVLWVLTPPDISRGDEVAPRDSNPDPGAGYGFPKKMWRRLRASLASGSVEDAAAEIFNYSKTAYMLQHLLYESQSMTISAYLSAPDAEAGYLRSQLSARWLSSLRQFDEDAENIEGQARSAGVPLAAVMIPGRAQAAMISKGESVEGADPYKLNDELRAAIVGHGGNYIDILPDFRDLPNPERLYFTIDGHPNVEGNAVIASLLARELTSGAIPVLRTADSMRETLKRRN